MNLAEQFVATTGRGALREGPQPYRPRMPEFVGPIAPMRYETITCTRCHGAHFYSPFGSCPRCNGRGTISVPVSVYRQGGEA